MKYIITLAMLLSINSIHSMDSIRDLNTDDESNRSNEIPAFPTRSTLESVTRVLQYQLGIKDIGWIILYRERGEGATIVATYFDHIKKGTTDPVIISKYDKRKTIANNIAEKLTRKLAIFCSNYNSAEKKVTFLTKHNQEWEQITQIDIDRACFLVDEYPNRLLAPEIVAALKDRIKEIKTIIDAIENSNKQQT